ncbi:MAG: mechanosensitive ion channel family protein [Aquabacterium sp.]
MEGMLNWLSHIPEGIDAALRTGLRLVVILALAWAASQAAHRLIRGFRLRLTARMLDAEAIQRAETLGRAMRYGASVLITALATMLVQSELGVSVAPLLGAAGVAGVDIGVAYATDLDHAIRTMETVERQLQMSPQHDGQIIAPLEIAGVEQWANSAVVIRARFKVAPLQQWTVRRAYLKQLKEAFDAQGIEIPFPHVTVVPKASDLTLGLTRPSAVQLNAEAG